MSRRDRWKSANEMGIDTWRHARRLGRTAAERIALFNVAMERRERHGARTLRANAKRRGLSSKATTSPRPNWYPWCFFIWTRNGPAPVLLSSVGTAASTPAFVDAGPAPPDRREDGQRDRDLRTGGHEDAGPTGAFRGAGRSGSHLTRRWRKPDSNHRSRGRPPPSP